MKPSPTGRRRRSQDGVLNPRRSRRGAIAGARGACRNLKERSLGLGRGQNAVQEKSTVRVWRGQCFPYCQGLLFAMRRQGDSDGLAVRRYRRASGGGKKRGVRSRRAAVFVALQAGSDTKPKPSGSEAYGGQPEAVLFINPFKHLNPCHRGFKPVQHFLCENQALQFSAFRSANWHEL